MITAFRWALRIFTGLVVLALLAVGIGYWFLSRSLPDYNASYDVPGIDQPVEIVRNSNDVPHIFGKDDADVFYALGFVHAQDRLWQMTLLRRTVQGRLSEIFGQKTLKTDSLMRRLDLYGLAAKSFDAQSDKTKAALKAYAKGVNAYIDIVNQQALGRGAPEFFLFSNKIATWQPADSLAIMKLMALKMTGAMQREILRARASLVLSPGQVKDLMPDDPMKPVAALPDYASLFPTVGKSYAAVKFGTGAMSPVGPPEFAGASNAWAAAPNRSAAGGSLLANDPHLDFTAPSLWYLARLQLKEGGVIGATIPGVPLVVLGRSKDLGWGLTTTYLDDQDIHIEKINPENSQQYLTPQGWKDFRTERSIVRVKGQSPVTLTLRWTDNGPVLPGNDFDLASITPAGHVTSLSWTALTDKDTSMTAGLDLMEAHSVQAGIEAGKLFVAPAQNLMLADKHGIAMQMIGWIPKRDPQNDTQGRMPTPGWLPRDQWDGHFPYSDNPSFVNPSTGILGNTNNKIVDRPFPLNVTFHWGDTQRIQRWLKLMKDRDVQTRESFIEAQLDTVSFTARSLLPLIARNLWYQGEDAPDGTPEAMRQQALKMLADWNGDMNEHMPEPLIYAAWMYMLQKRLVSDELGPLAQDFSRPNPVFLERVFRNTDGAAKWCDIVQSAQKESCTDIARMSLDDALLWLKQHYGPKIESWRWGDAHQAVQDHSVLGTTPIIRYFVNLRQSVSGGDNTLDRGLTKASGSDPFLDVHGPSYRGVYDFADPDSSVFIISTGESGQPLSRHYDDLGELWRRGEYIPMSLDPALAKAGAVGITHLKPEKGQ
ncbi:penicillin acylase family protein [Acidimangrovimonas sediminis]|uniref:penicillin acylase family protein n=1 Tax=Acidimangrovimonas sediminis TaxID=2056283 RepID=UPI000C80CB18|nr:penicillin acylase family protein [Acidimangrovimonas sediminis]